MTNLQLEMAIADVREQLNEVFNEHAELRTKVRQLRVLAGLETAENPVSSPEIDTHTHNTCGIVKLRKP